MGPTAIALIAAVIVIAGLSLTLHFSKQGFTGSSNTVKVETPKLQSLVSQAKQWNTTSTKKSDPLQRFLYTNYALAFLGATLQLVTASEASKLTKEDVSQLMTTIRTNHVNNIETLNIRYPGQNLDPALSLIEPIA